MWSLLAIGWAVTAAMAQTNGLPGLVQFLGRTDDPQVQRDILRGLSDGLKGRRSAPMPAGWEAVAEKLERSPDADIRRLAQGLSLTFGSTRALAHLRQEAADAQAEPAVRRQALATLLAAKDPTLGPTLQRLLHDPAVRAAALRGLAAYEDPKTPEAILAVYPSLPAAERRDALATLTARAGFARSLLAAVAAKTVSTRDLTADLVMQLRQLNDPEINRQVQSVWGTARESAADRMREIGRYKKMIEVLPAGDPLRGREVFARACQQCHALFGDGGKVGPDLTGHNRADLDYLLQNIIDPNAVIPNDYRTSTLETTDDRVITGVVTRQDESAVTIVTANETLVVPRKEVQSLEQGQLSLMPEGLLQALSDDEVRDLMVYLRDAKPPAAKPSEAQAQR